MMTSLLAELPAAALPLDEETPRPDLRVLHVLEATLGGTLRYIENLMEALAPLSIPTAFVYGVSRADHRLEPALRRAQQLGWELFEAPMQRPVHPASDFASFLALRRAMRRFRPTLVHCHSSKAGALGRVAARTLEPRPRLVYSPHALAPGAGYLRIERGLARCTDRFLAVSASEQQQLGGLGLSPAAGIGVVYPVVDAAHFAPRDRETARAELDLPREAPLLLGIGRLTAQKRPLDYLDVLRRVRERVPGCLGVWVGEGELRAAFEARAAALGLAQTVRITGWIADVRPYIAASDLVLSTSAFESFGYNLAEALAMERPGVGSRVCGTMDVLREGIAPVFFSPGDTAVAAECIVPILESPVLARRLGRAGRAMVQHCFSSAKMRADLVRFYNSTLGSGAAKEAV